KKDCMSTMVQKSGRGERGARTSGVTVGEDVWGDGGEGVEGRDEEREERSRGTRGRRRISLALSSRRLSLEMGRRIATPIVVLPAGRERLARRTMGEEIGEANCLKETRHGVEKYSPLVVASRHHLKPALLRILDRGYAKAPDLLPILARFCHMLHQLP
ncbi:hypothetical protein PFISCL1PPCAC_532, partial [Pristionchus fissidentatus]